MKLFDKSWLITGVAKEMNRRMLTGIDGYPAHYRNYKYFEDCRGVHLPTGTVLIFTRDQGMHTSGWLKNPDYDQCYHLSLSFVDPENLKQPVGKDNKLTQQWIDAIYPPDYKKLIWAEPPYSPEGKVRDTWHYRVFTDRFWQPILPKKEVYTKEFTPKGWLSYSDVQAKELQLIEDLQDKIYD